MCSIKYSFRTRFIAGPFFIFGTAVLFQYISLALAACDVKFRPHRICLGMDAKKKWKIGEIEIIIRKI